jgi:centrosomal protein CEP95
MEKDIEDFQEQLYRDEDEAYFRQLDADRLRHELNMAKYQTKI